MTAVSLNRMQMSRRRHRHFGSINTRMYMHVENGTGWVKGGRGESLVQRDRTLMDDTRTRAARTHKQQSGGNGHRV